MLLTYLVFSELCTVRVFSCISSTRIPSPRYQDTKITTLLIGQINWLELRHHYSGGVFMFSVRYCHKSLSWQFASSRLSDEISMAPSIYCLYKAKSEIHPVTYHNGPEREYRYSCNLF